MTADFSLACFGHSADYSSTIQRKKMFPRSCETMQSTNDSGDYASNRGKTRGLLANIIRALVRVAASDATKITADGAFAPVCPRWRIRADKHDS